MELEGLGQDVLDAQEYIASDDKMKRIGACVLECMIMTFGRAGVKLVEHCTLSDVVILNEEFRKQALQDDVLRAAFDRYDLPLLG